MSSKVLGYKNTQKLLRIIIISDPEINLNRYKHGILLCGSTLVNFYCYKHAPS